MKKHLLLPVLAILLVAGATAWAVSDRDPTVARDKGPVRVDGLDTPPPGIGPPRPPGGAPMPGGGLQPPGGPPPGGGGPQPPMGFGGGAPGQPPFPPGGGGSKIDYKELIPTLIAALDDDDGDVRKAVAVTLTRIGQPAVDPLLGVLKDKDKSKASRANAAYVLGRIGSPAREALPALTKALKESDRDLRRRAAFALAHVVSDYQGGMSFPGGMLPGPGMGVGGRRGGSEELPDPGVVLPSHEKSSEKGDKPSDKTDRSK